MKANFILLMCLVTLTLGAVINKKFPDVEEQQEIDVARIESAESPESLEDADDMETSATFHKRFYYPRSYYYPHYYPNYYYPRYHYPQSYYYQPAANNYNRPRPCYSQPLTQHRPVVPQLYQYQTTTTTTAPSLPPSSIDDNQQYSSSQSNDTDCRRKRGSRDRRDSSC